MPEVQENSDRVKLNEVRRRTVAVARLWLDLYVACSNGDAGHFTNRSNTSRRYP